MDDDMRIDFALISHDLATLDKELDGTNRCEFTLMNRAIRLNYYDGVAYFIKRGVDVNRIHFIGRTSLYNAVLYSYDKSIEVVQILVEAGADVNWVNIHGVSVLALFFTPSRQKIRIATFLIDHGADTSVLKDDLIPHTIKQLVTTRNKTRLATIAMMSTHRKTHMIQQNGKDALRLIAKHIWSLRMGVDITIP
jgi:ankyrin repeat protein